MVDIRSKQPWGFWPPGYVPKTRRRQMSIIASIADRLGLVSNVDVADLKAELREIKVERDRYKKAFEALRDMIREIEVHKL